MLEEVRRAEAARPRIIRISSSSASFYLPCGVEAEPSRPLEVLEEVERPGPGTMIAVAIVAGLIGWAIFAVIGWAAWALTGLLV